MAGAVGFQVLTSRNAVLNGAGNFILSCLWRLGRGARARGCHRGAGERSLSRQSSKLPDTRDCVRRRYNIVSEGERFPELIGESAARSPISREHAHIKKSNRAMCCSICRVETASISMTKRIPKTCSETVCRFVSATWSLSSMPRIRQIETRGRLRSLHPSGTALRA